MKLKDLMSRDVQVIDANATIMEAAERMRKGNFGMMPVGENDRIICPDRIRLTSTPVRPPADVKPRRDSRLNCA